MNNNVNGVSADSSFYICFVDDLEEKEWVYKFTRLYSTVVPIIHSNIHSL